MPSFRAEARWSLVGSFGLPEWPGRGAREINQAGLALHVAPLTKPPEEGTESRGLWRRRRKERGTQNGQGHCSPADKHGEHRAAKVPSFRSGRGFLISRQREPVVCHAVSNCVEGHKRRQETEGACKRGMGDG